MANTLKFKTARELQDAIDCFDTWIEAKGYKYKTVTRLAEYLDTTRQTLINYQDGKQQGIDDAEADKIRHVLSRVKQSLEADEHDRLYDRNTARGAEFSLKNNHGWSDRQSLDIGGDGVKVTLGPDVAGLAK